VSLSGIFIMWKVAFLVVVTLWFASGCQYKKNECPDYTVLEQHSDYEIRSYPAITWVSTTELSRIQRVAQYNAFMRLFRYISGKNDKEQKIAMTVPVRTQITKTENGTLLEMSFMVPAEFASNPPVPTDEKVTIQEENSTNYAVRTFKGYIWRQGRWTEEAKKLADSVKNDETVDKTTFYLLGYDAPFEVFDRRNEIWMIKNA